MVEKSVKLTGSVSSGILDKLVLREASIRESLSDDSRAILVVDSPNPNLSPEDFLGETLCLDIKTSAGNRYHHGIVVAMSHLHDTLASKTRYQLTVSSWTELLDRKIVGDSDIAALQASLDVHGPDVAWPVSELLADRGGAANVGLDGFHIGGRLRWRRWMAATANIFR